ncbi:glycosyltransferase [Carboxylicivirga marina]|uniref:glycosyltransferase n=1 Tax=Carboxylicivirga marina TaxID=2800988 RepID=UPI0025973FC8|nr:glycosyltransferase [uncultured Carboxylicivirga sp.]
MKKPKILFLLTNLTGGGAEKVLVDILKKIDTRKYDINLCLLFAKGSLLEEVPKNISIIEMFSNNIVYSFLFHFRSKFNFELPLKLYVRNRIGNSYDLIIPFMEGFSTLIASYCRGIKKIAWIHTDLLKNPVSSWLYKSDAHENKVYNLMDELVFVSNDAKRAFNEKYATLINGVIINNPIFDKEIVNKSNEFNVDKRKFTIASIGRFTRIKRFDRLLKGCKLLLDKGFDFELWLLGEGDLQKQYEDLVKEYKLDSTVRFLGFKKNPYPYLSEADLFVSSSLAEGFPLVLCEAIVLGIPILATNTTGSKEILNGGEYGLLVDNSTEGMQNGMYDLVSSPSKIKYYKGQSEKRRTFLQSSKVMSDIYKVVDSHLDI